MEFITTGSSRWVILTEKYAFKFPNLTTWYRLTKGLVANMDELNRYKKFGSQGAYLCPVRQLIPGGFLNVMPRLKLTTTAEWTANPNLFQNFSVYAGTSFGCEHDAWYNDDIKSMNFGWLGNSVVRIDYGNIG